ncbi:IS1 transposase orfB [Escherichia coli P12b]|nr:IS1 transposase orfB [Escherichia coli P12b]
MPVVGNSLYVRH